MTGRRAIKALLALTLTAAVFASASASDTPTQAQPGTRAVLFVANNWDGTADVVDPATFQRLGRFNTVPDLEERLAEIQSNPVRLGYFIGVRQLIGEGNDQFADDMFSSHDGRFVYISRPSLADVVGIDLKTNAIVWRFAIEGQRSDHMAISPDGARLLVSDSTARKVHVLDAQTGKKVGEFESGDSPHENNYSADGKRIFHASIGLVYTPADQPIADSTKGDRWFQIVDAQTNQVIKRLELGPIMAAHGYPDMSSAVRPMAISPDEKTAYFQLSFHHGFVEFDLTTDKPKRVASLPLRGDSTTTPREDYLLDSAHHGLAINPDGTKLCAAGTMSDYAAIVSTADFSHTIIDVGPKPYWSTNSGDGRYCFVSVSGADQVVAIDYETAREVARIPVGDHPQRMRMGVIRSEYVGAMAAAPATRRVPARLHVTRVRVRGGRLELRVRMSKRASGKLGVTYHASGRRARFEAPIPAGRRAFTVRRKLDDPRRGGLVEVTYAGDDDVAGDRVRLRTGARAAKLRHAASSIDEQGRLTVAGTIARRARGTAQVQLSYTGDSSRVRVLRYRARIAGGRWRLQALLPSRAARAGGHLSVVYAGDAGRRIRGEQVTRTLAP